MAPIYPFFYAINCGLSIGSVCIWLANQLIALRWLSGLVVRRGRTISYLPIGNNSARSLCQQHCQTIQANFLMHACSIIFVRASTVLYAHCTRYMELVRVCALSSTRGLLQRKWTIAVLGAIRCFEFEGGGSCVHEHNWIAASAADTSPHHPEHNDSDPLITPWHCKHTQQPNTHIATFYTSTSNIFDGKRFLLTVLPFGYAIFFLLLLCCHSISWHIPISGVRFLVVWLVGIGSEQQKQPPQQNKWSQTLV